jgi:general stress protein 26
MEVLEDSESKEMIWRDGDTMYYPKGVVDSIALSSKKILQYSTIWIRKILASQIHILLKLHN